jgi:hypothetical protein
MSVRVYGSGAFEAAQEARFGVDAGLGELAQEDSGAESHGVECDGERRFLRRAYQPPSAIPAPLIQCFRALIALAIPANFICCPLYCGACRLRSASIGTAASKLGR